MRLRMALVLWVVGGLTACGGGDSGGTGAAAEAPPLVIYSARNEQLIGPLIARYQTVSGQAVQLVTADAGPLLERLKAEGQSTPADVLLTVDAGNLWQAAEQDLLLPLPDSALVERIPAHLRDPEHRWFGLSVRARTIVHHRERVPADQLSTYAALGDPAFGGRLCLRTSKKVYGEHIVRVCCGIHNRTRDNRSIVRAGDRDCYIFRRAVDRLYRDRIRRRLT